MGFPALSFGLAILNYFFVLTAKKVEILGALTLTVGKFLTPKMHEKIYEFKWLFTCFVFTKFNLVDLNPENRE